MANDGTRSSVHTTTALDYTSKLPTPLRGHSTYMYVFTVWTNVRIYVEDIYLWTAQETDHEDSTQLQTDR